MTEQREANALTGHLADINDRASKLYKICAYNRIDDLYHCKAYEKELYSLQKEFYSFELYVDNCICNNPSECTEYSCIPLEKVDDILKEVQILIWEIYIKERQWILREEINVVEGLSAWIITKTFPTELIPKCQICGEYYFVGDCCYLSCNEDVIFHRNCIRKKFEMIATIFHQAYVLRSEIIRQKSIYEADRDSKADIYTFKLYTFVRDLELLRQEFKYCKSEIDYCECDNLSPECKRCSYLLERVDSISYDIMFLIWECWSDDLKERVERKFQSKIMQVVEGLPVIKITETNVNEKGECAICFIDLEISEEVCHLPCNEGHIFHRDCIGEWMKRANYCPFCRMPVYRPKHSVYHATIGRLEILMSWF